MVTNWEGTYSNRPRTTQGNWFHDIWGYSDGLQVFIHHLQDYFPIYSLDGSLGFYGFGMVDLEVVPIARKFAKQKGKLPVDKTQKNLYYLNLLNGTIVGSQGPGTLVSDLDNRATLILYRPYKKEQDVEMRFELSLSDGGAFGDVIFPGGCTEFFPMAGEKIDVCKKIGPNKCVELILKPGEIRYIKCSYTYRDDYPMISEVDKDVGKVEAEKPLEDYRGNQRLRKEIAN